MWRLSIKGSTRLPRNKAGMILRMTSLLLNECRLRRVRNFNFKFNFTKSCWCAFWAAYFRVAWTHRSCLAGVFSHTVRRFHGGECQIHGLISCVAVYLGSCIRTFRSPEDARSWFLRNLGTNLLNFTAPPQETVFLITSAFYRSHVLSWESN